MQIKTKKGDATAVTRTKNRGVILAHIVNCKGAWGGGFVLALNKMSPIPKASYQAWYSQCGTDIPLGETLFVEVSPGKFVANMCAQKSIDRQNDGPCLIDYDAFDRCMRITFLRALRMGYSVHMPEGIGSGLAGGDKTKIHGIIESAAKKAETESKFAKMVQECLNQTLELDITLWQFDDKTSVSYVPQDLGEAAEDEEELTAKPDDIASI
jgi:hypothetical protein